MGKKTPSSPDFDRLFSEMSELRSDLRKYTEQVHTLQASTLFAEFRKNCAEIMMKAYRDSGCDAIGRESSGCQNWERCSNVFGALFDSILTALNSGELRPEDIKTVREKAYLLRSHASSDRCEACHTEMKKQLDKQIGMLQSIGVYKETDDISARVLSLSDEDTASLFNDALSSPVRVQILKSLYREGKSFTELSNLTGLRGGNLLFHLDKLQKSGVIYKDGEYQMSYRGYEVLNTVAHLFRDTPE